MRDILYSSGFGGNKNAGLIETHTLEIRNTTRRCLDSLLSSNNDEQPNEQAVLQLVPNNHPLYLDYHMRS